MKNTTIAKKMYYCALNYFDACEKLKKDLLHDNNPSIIYPLLYLERHTLELLLKAIILFSYLFHKPPQKNFFAHKKSAPIETSAQKRKFQSSPN